MGPAKHSTCGLSRRARVVVEPSDQRTYAQTESRQTESRQNKTGHRLRCLHSKDISMALPKLRGVQGELAETLVAELSTLQPHPCQHRPCEHCAPTWQPPADHRHEGARTLGEKSLLLP